MRAVDQADSAQYSLQEVLAPTGGGHANAGTCQVAHEEADRVGEELVGHLNAATGATV